MICESVLLAAHLVTLHVPAVVDGYRYNGLNPGAQAACALNPHWSAAAGGYWNSRRRTTVYAAAVYERHLGAFGAGVFAGPATGYREPVVAGVRLSVLWQHVETGVLIAPPAAGPLAIHLTVGWRF